MKRWSNLWSCYVSLVLGCGLIISTGLISGWGTWYSRDITYRRQAEALFRGTFALGTDPGRLTWDMAWSRGKIQQPWGLGAPAWRVPFDAIAKLFGREAFPDRLSFAMVVSLLTYTVLKLFIHGPWRGVDSAEPGLLQHVDAIAAVLLLILFPPFVTLCRTRFRMYEEAAAYAYLAGIALFCGTLAFVRNPRLTSYSMLGLVAGLAGFVRPTLVAYSAASMMIASIYTGKLRWSIGKRLLGPVLFCIGGGLLLLTNLYRFGSAFEFGHRLNLNGLDVMRFVTRFQDPFRTTPPLSAAVELASSLFLAGNHFNGLNYYQLGFFPGQARTIRWREFYFTTFDFTFLLMMLGAGYLLAWQWRRRFRGLDIACSIEIRVMATWTLISLGLLFAFYVYFPSLSSRYLMDFGPGVAAAIWLFLFLFKNWLRMQYNASQNGVIAILIGIFAWWVIEVFPAAIQPGYASDRPVNYNQLLLLSREIQEYRIPPQPLPDEYGLTTVAEQHYGLPFNGDGWDSVSGKTKAAVTLFVRDPELVELVVAPTDGAKLSDADYGKVQAKIGLENLKLENIQECVEGRILLFGGPKLPIYQSGLQVAFLGFVRAKELDTGDSSFRLLRVRWHRESNRAINTNSLNHHG